MPCSTGGTDADQEYASARSKHPGGVNVLFGDGHVEFVADDGARRGDGAPVLVVHTTAEMAKEHLDEPNRAVAPIVTAVHALVGSTEPVWSYAHRWTFAKPSSVHAASYHLTESSGRRIGFAGDQWCPSGAPRIESAWRSGTDLGRALVASR